MTKFTNESLPANHPHVFDVRIDEPTGFRFITHSEILSGTTYPGGLGGANEAEYALEGALRSAHIGYIDDEDLVIVKTGDHWVEVPYEDINTALEDAFNFTP